jgi:hypothetical protein
MAALRVRVRVREEFGPTLPAALRRSRFRVPAGVTVGVVAVVGLVIAVLVVRAITSKPAPGTQVNHSAPPVFNLLYPPAAMHRAAPGAGELMRLEGRQAKLRVAVVVRPLRLPHFAGDVTHGLLPVLADRYAAVQQRSLPGFVLTDEGRARVNNGVGYEIGWQAVRPGSRTYGRDVLLVPDDMTEGQGYVVLSMRQTKPGGPFTGPEKGLVGVVRKAYRSFRFGTARG